MSLNFKKAMDIYRENIAAFHFYQHGEKVVFTLEDVT